MEKRGSSRDIRKLLKERDKEICAECGRDCAMVERIMRHAGAACTIYKWANSLPLEYYILRIFGFTPYRATWNADHIIPLKEGGSDDLENFQTLCNPCHLKKTNKEKKQRLTGENNGTTN